MEPYEIISHLISTEKNIRQMEAENKLVFAVSKNAKKSEIKSAVEELFNVKVVKVSTLLKGGKKRAYVKLSPETPAMDVATQLGMM
ncbi:50S ribosomal protein L23 [Candidatus Woesearchaeota archaeon]|nr:50S ribosomal protein L23 [Candidatus Woesearchaeota archaeon]